MDQSVKERSRRNFVMKNDYVQVSDGSQMHEVRKMACAQDYGFGIKRRGRDAGSLEDYGPDGVKQSLREVRLDGGSPFRSQQLDRKSTRLNSSHGYISYAVFCLKKKKKSEQQ